MLIKFNICLHDASIAQLDRASDFGSEGCGFESYWRCNEFNRERKQNRTFIKIILISFLK